MHLLNHQNAIRGLAPDVFVMTKKKKNVFVNAGTPDWFSSIGLDTTFFRLCSPSLTKTSRSLNTDVWVSSNK